MGNVLLTILTVLGSAGCAVTGILVNRHISLRQLKTQEAGTIITNAEYWRKEVETFTAQIADLRKQLLEAEKKISENELKSQEQEKEIEKLNFKYYRVEFEKDQLQQELNSYHRASVKTPTSRNLYREKSESENEIS